MKRTLEWPEHSDVFDISEGNAKVLQCIPAMMQDPEFRKKLRHLTLDWMQTEAYAKQRNQTMRQKNVSIYVDAEKGD